MDLNEKYSNLRNECLVFINELDEDIYLEIQQHIEFILNDNEIDLKHGVKQLREFYDQLTSMVNAKKEANNIEKSFIIDQKRKFPSITSSMINSEVFNYIKKLIEKRQSFFDSECIQLANQFKKPKIGTLPKEIEDWLNQITEADFIKEKKTHETLLSISQSTIESILFKLKTSLDKFASDNFELFNNQTATLHKEIKTYLESHSIEGFEIPDKISYHNKLIYDELIMTCLRFDETFIGKIPKQNFRSIILDVRSYSIMFFLILSMFGVNRGLLMKNETMNIVFYLFTFILVYIGILYTIKKTQDSKIEKMEEELNKAKDNISKGIKKIIEEFFSEWNTSVKSYFKTIISDISSETERIIKSDTNIKTQKKEDQKQQFDEQLLHINARESNYNKILLSCKNMGYKFNQLEREIEISAQSKNKLAENYSVTNIK